MKEKRAFLLHFSRFFVTLEEFSAFLYIKAVWGIERKWGYDLATVLNSTFCYKLRQRTPDAEPPAILWLIIGCKGNHFCRKSQIYSHLFLPNLLNTFGNTFELIAASFVVPARKVRIRLRPFTDFYADYSYVSNYLTTFAHIIHNR